MTRSWKLLAAFAALAGLIWACGHDDSLREYLSSQFWYPFARHGTDNAAPDTRRLSAPFAGMDGQTGPLARLRSHYQSVARSEGMTLDPRQAADLVTAARATPNLTAREREEIDLIDAKLDIRAGMPKFQDPWRSAERKLLVFLQTAKSPEFRSEARGWLAHVYFNLGDLTRAGKIYIDELGRTDSNLSLATLRDSLAMVYGYSGGRELPANLDKYFDTPEHAVFAITILTNPRWVRDRWVDHSTVAEQPPFDRINELLRKHQSLFRSDSGAQTLAALAMRTALRAGDPAAALMFAANIPPNAPVRKQPSFLWMLGSVNFLSRRYQAAEAPLRRLHGLRTATSAERAAAAYGLCGVYAKTGNRVEQIRMALWLKTLLWQSQTVYLSVPGSIRDGSVYWAISGWDLGIVLDLEASDAELRAFLDKYGSVPDARLVRYALAIRLARADRYAEAAEEFSRLGPGARGRATRMRTLAALWARIENNNDMAARVDMAEFLADNSTSIYFNPTLWGGFQNEALPAGKDTRLTRAERDRLLAAERRLRDQQEEHWRAYQLAQDVVKAEGRTELGRRAARLAIRCLRRINTDRFGRAKEIAAADVALTRWLRGLG